MVQDTALPFITYPLILGEDIAGTVEIVGSAAISKFKVGDRVLGMAFGAKPEQGGFQEYVTLDHTMACKIPNSLSFKDASVFPLCIATAAHALFSKDYLSMPLPSTNSISTGKSILIWGGSSGVGSNAIQLSKAAGFRVVTTCSTNNFEYVKSLGTDKVFDYKSPSVIDDIVTELDNSLCIGIFHAAGDVALSCQVSHKSKQKLFVAASSPIPEGAAPDGVEAKMLFSSAGTSAYKEAITATFGGFLPEALSKDIYKVAPPPEAVSRKGLKGIQEGLDILKKGVSAKKIVIEAKYT